MASNVHLIIAQANENLTENVKNATEKTPSTPEGMAVAYGSLVIMAMLPIFFGSYRSVAYHKENKPEKMTKKDAAIFPIMASCALVALYIVFKLFSKEYINLLLTGYFFFLGVLALTHLLSPVVSKLVPAAIPNIPFHILFKQGEGDNTQFLIDYRFSTYDVVSLIACSLVGAWYLIQKHWVANNLFGLAFAVNAVELLHLNNVVTGCILLCGLFFYDIFWVFGTDVMVTVAKSFEAPIKLVFPQDLLQNGLAANNFAMLGLGDIVIPGIFIALLLRFDNSLKRKTKTYFHASVIAYFLGLMATIFVMHVFKHAQPALLYLVPACLGTPLSLALLKGDLTAMFKYEDSPENEKSEEKKIETQPKQEAKKAK
ncbi:minor histocompatibility antigen H13 [Diorhabda carinulata]|uniref:minor histocompatibility antigen H13 n=1 Tax=Diorhabda sublineata TaxID=1163346 RepID=UPI0024E13B38|nr:minor histocompatibility antigen H13 [Diorhabda sublineata]XP_057658382.1 minor histocompatibility antigen H13 [Diorhabda carinulata]